MSPPFQVLHFASSSDSTLKSPQSVLPLPLRTGQESARPLGRSAARSPLAAESGFPRRFPPWRSFAARVPVLGGVAARKGSDSRGRNSNGRPVGVEGANAVTLQGRVSLLRADPSHSLPLQPEAELSAHPAGAILFVAFAGDGPRPQGGSLRSPKASERCPGGKTNFTPRLLPRVRDGVPVCPLDDVLVWERRHSAARLSQGTRGFAPQPLDWFAFVVSSSGARNHTAGSREGKSRRSGICTARGSTRRSRTHAARCASTSV